jgi:DNA-binding SARP family transcriptional activator
VTQLRVLGDVELHVGGREVELGHARQRAVLAVLAVEAGRPVPVAALVSRLWAEQPPVRAEGALYNYLSRLRRAVAGCDDLRIVRRAGGYQLSIEPSLVDIFRFRQLVDEARNAGTAPVALLDEALALWRGRPFGELDTPWFDQVREQWEAERRAAGLDRADALLSLGRAGETLAFLGAAAATEPLDERVAEQYLLALYRCGRQADALVHYETLRRLLADELGAGPGPALQRLHQRILTADPGLDMPRRTAPVPRQLPAPRPFSGRAAELAALDALVELDGDRQATVVISALSGTAGVGKTSLAVFWARQVADDYPDGQLYLNLRGFDPGGAALSSSEALHHLLDGLGVPAPRIPRTPEAQQALYRSLTTGRRMLVVLDNARDADQVRPLLPGTADAVVLITSRNELTGLVVADGAQPLVIGLMSRADSYRLIVDRIGPQRAAADPGATDDLIRYCAGLPLALAVVAARAATNPRLSTADLASELSDSRQRLDALATDDPSTDVRAVLSWSYRALTPGAARLFRLFGMHPGPEMSVAAAASLAGLPMAEVRRLLTELTRNNMIDGSRVPGRYALHDLLRAYAEQQAADDEDARRRMFDHYLHTAYAAARMLSPHRAAIALDPTADGVLVECFAARDEALAWFRRERAVLTEVIAAAAAASADRHAWQIAWCPVEYFDRQGHWQDWEDTQRIALASARRLGDPEAEAVCCRLLGYACARSGRPDEARAYLAEGLRFGEQSGDLVGQARAHSYLGVLNEREHRYSLAIEDADRALALYEAAGYRVGVAFAYNTLGWYRALDGRPDLGHCRRALELHRALGNRAGEAATWDSLGYLEHHRGDHERAEESYARALVVYRELGDRPGEAGTLTRLGELRIDAGRPEPARTAWSAAVAILDEIDDPAAEQLRVRLRELG